MIAGLNYNYVVLDLETRHSAEDCRTCGQTQDTHQYGQFDERRLIRPCCSAYAPYGWDDHAALGLSIGCYYDSRDSRLHWFDTYTLYRTMWTFVEQWPLVVSFNGRALDGPLMLACVAEGVTPDGEPATDLPGRWQALWGTSYDILAEIWRVDPTRKFERGLNSLGALSAANGFGAKEMTGATAPRLWAQGRYAEVIAYNVGDVLKTKALFEQILETGQILRGDGLPIALPRPEEA